MKKFIINYTLYTAFIIVLSFGVQGQPGSLDNRFGEQGKIYNKEFNGEADVVAVQKDGKILAAGLYNIDDETGIHVSRYNNDGNLDTAFAENGRFLLLNAEGYRFGVTRNMLIQENGKILIGARSIRDAEDQDILIIRLNTDGSLDNSFSENGIANLSIGPYDDELGEMALQQDGKIVVAGLKDPSGFGYYDNEIPFILRLNTDGTYDNSFGTNGIVVQDFNDIYVRIRSLIILPDGKMIMGGDDDGYNDRQVVMFKYNLDGNLDTSFGNKGIAESRFPKDEYGRNIIAYIYDFVRMPSGKIFIAGMDISYKMFLSQFTSTGIVDTGFGINKGYIRMSNLPAYRYGKQAYLAKGNKIVVGGSNFTAYRFLENGELDSSFGENGIAGNSFEVPSSTGVRGCAIQPDGKIILAGSGANRNDDYSHICMLRLHGDGGITQQGYVRIKRWMKKNGISWWPGMTMKNNTKYTVERSNDKMNFTPIASISKPQSGRNGEYSFEDLSPAKGNNYYRLAYTNEEGKTVYSNIISIENTASLNIYPNPVTNYLKVEGIDGKTKLYITDISGNIKMATNTTNKNLNWNVAALSKGYYILKIETDGIDPVIKKFYKE